MQAMRIVKHCKHCRIGIRRIYNIGWVHYCNEFTQCVINTRLVPGTYAEPDEEDEGK